MIRAVYLLIEAACNSCVRERDWRCRTLVQSRDMSPPGLRRWCGPQSTVHDLFAHTFVAFAV